VRQGAVVDDVHGVIKVGALGEFRQRNRFRGCRFEGFCHELIRLYCIACIALREHHTRYDVPDNLSLLID
jgi:hypothetical protein